MPPEVCRLQDYEIPHYLVNHTDLTVELSEKPNRSKSRLTIQPNPQITNRKSDLVLDCENMVLRSVRLNGQLLSEDDYQLVGHSLIIKDVPKDTFDIECETVLGENSDLFGLYQTEGTCIVKAETLGMRRVMPCIDRPDVLSKYTVTIIAKKEDYPVLLSNGELINEEELPDGKHKVTWYDSVPKPTYLFALVAGKLEQSATTFTTQSGRKLPIEFYVPPAAIEKCGLPQEILKRALKSDEKTYGLECPLPGYKVAGVYKYATGASEPTGLNLFNLMYLLATPANTTDHDLLFTFKAVFHEYAHLWSGDLITIRDWFNLALKEGLTTYRTTEFLEKLFGRGLTRLYEGKQFDEHAPRPDSYTSVRNLYGSSAYGKSGYIFKMMMLEVGEEEYHKGVRKFFDDYQGQAVTLEHFIGSLSQSSGRDLSAYLVWFTEPGIPQVDVTDEYNPETQQYTLKFRQSSSTPDYKVRPVTVTTGLLDQDGREIIGERTLIFDQKEQAFTFDNMPSKPTPSLLRSFSAPVALSYNYQIPDLLHLMRHDTDLSNRYEASRKLINTLVRDYCSGKPIQLDDAFYSVYKELLRDKTLDQWVLAEIIRLPSEEELIKVAGESNFEKIHEAHTLIANALATNLKADFEACFSALERQPAEPNPEFPGFDIKDARKRRLKNVCLTYLSLVDEHRVLELANQQFTGSLSWCMTETIDALNLLSNMKCSESKTALKQFLDQFYNYWQERDDSNAINYWFRIQASSHSTNTIDMVKGLMAHPAFDMTNPNKVRALLQPFVNNLYGFHDASGKGYELLADVIIKLDAINPPLASQFTNCFVKWDRYDGHRQDMMYRQLLCINARTSSANVKSVVEEGLAKGNPIAQTRPPASSLLKWMETGLPPAPPKETASPSLKPT